MVTKRLWSRSVAERLEVRREVTSSGCWLWTGAKGGDTYGQINVLGVRRPVHVVSWEHYRGPVPEGYEVDHVKARGCTSVLCFNPDHLEPVTKRENIARSDAAWAKFARGKCQRGHDTTDPSNVYVRRNGYRMCRECQRMRRPHNRKRFES